MEERREAKVEERKASPIFWDHRYVGGFGRWVWILHAIHFRGFQY
jgi:hypothetical protein